MSINLDLSKQFCYKRKRGIFLRRPMTFGSPLSIKGSENLVPILSSFYHLYMTTLRYSLFLNTRSFLLKPFLTTNIIHLLIYKKLQLYPIHQKLQKNIQIFSLRKYSLTTLHIQFDESEMLCI